MASLFWVGGTATWDATIGTKWATTTGGAGGSAVPLASDDVFFDANSTGTVTMSASSVCRSLNCTGFTGTLSHPGAVTVTIGDATAGASNVALLLTPQMKYATGGTSAQFTFASTSATQQTVDWGGKAAGHQTFSGVGGSWILNSDYQCNGLNNIFTLTGGALVANGHSALASNFRSNGSSTRSIDLGTGTWISNGAGGGATVWNMTTTGLTLTANLATIRCQGTNSAVRTFAGGGFTYGNVYLSGGTGDWTITGANTFGNLFYYGPFINNYQGVSVGNGMSTGEKVR